MFGVAWRAGGDTCATIKQTGTFVGLGPWRAAVSISRRQLCFSRAVTVKNHDDYYDGLIQNIMVVLFQRNCCHKRKSLEVEKYNSRKKERENGLMTNIMVRSTVKDADIF